MKENLRKEYFLLLRITVAALFEIYLLITTMVLNKGGYLVLFVAACFFTAVVLYGLLEPKKVFSYDRITGMCLYTCFLIEVLTAGILVGMTERSFTLLFGIVILDMLRIYSFGIFWYVLPLGLSFLTGVENFGVNFMFLALTSFLYFQHNEIVLHYSKQIKEREDSEMSLKRDMQKQKYSYQEDLKNNMLKAENALLEEREHLSQTLHDKLGHSINGSIYQLEACKVLLDRDTTSVEKMIQLVIDNLRNGMDEIRCILRKERPKKHKLAIQELQRLCRGCEEKGIFCTLQVNGEIDQIPEAYLEVMLDNSYEAVSNALKYAGCTKIIIEITKWNQFAQCRILDNGVGCSEIIEGMGLSGMRHRMRNIGGILDFESEIGFVVKMLFPLKGEKDEQNKSNHCR